MVLPHNTPNGNNLNDSFRVYCRNQHESFRPLFLKFTARAHKNSVLKEYLNQHPDLNCLIGKFMGKTSAVKKMFEGFIIVTI